MKKFLFLMFVLFGALVCAPVIAQEVINNPVIPSGMGFETFAALAAIVPFAVELIKRFIPKIPSLAVQIMSWSIGVIFALVGWYFNLGFLAGLTWWLALLYGIAAGLVGNGIADTGIIDKIFGTSTKKT